MKLLVKAIKNITAYNFHSLQHLKLLTISVHCVK
jgi:hypothetical protein